MRRATSIRLRRPWSDGAALGEVRIGASLALPSDIGNRLSIALSSRILGPHSSGAESPFLTMLWTGNVLVAPDRVSPETGVLVIRIFRDHDSTEDAKDRLDMILKARRPARWQAARRWNVVVRGADDNRVGSARRDHNQSKNQTTIIRARAALRGGGA